MILIFVRRIMNESEKQEIFRIRQEVFVQEQNVPADEEYDEYDQTAVHLIAFYEGVPCGTMRWRETDKGIKLERFAVLKDFRNRGVAGELVETALYDIEKSAPDADQKMKYLHSQTSAMNVYKRYGFEPIGELFYECEIPHYKMVLSKS